MWLFFLLVLAFVIVSWTVYGAWLRRSFHEQDASDEIHFVTTGDGARLALYRYRPKGDVRRHEPVIFVHGLGASKYNLDFDDTYSWARRFARDGFDAWVVDLRGAGMSVPPRKWNWCFDDYADFDVPAAVAHIRARTGAEKLHWVGHSMGGMLLYAYLGAGHDHIRSGVTLGSPVRFSSARHFEGSLKLMWMLDYLAFVPLRTAIHLIVPFLPLVRKSDFVRSQMNPDNVDFGFIKRVAYNAVHHLPAPLLRQFGDWVRNDCFRSFDRRIDYQARLRTIDLPIQVIAGSGDRIVRPEDARYAWELMPGKNTRYVEAGRETGFSHDYGHIDLVFGREANREIVPLVLDWIVAHEPLSVADGRPMDPPPARKTEVRPASTERNAAITAPGSNGFEK